jgi:hypothetical protein
MPCLSCSVFDLMRSDSQAGREGGKGEPTIMLRLNTDRSEKDLFDSVIS